MAVPAAVYRPRYPQATDYKSASKCLPGGLLYRKKRSLLKKTGDNPNASPKGIASADFQ